MRQAAPNKDMASRDAGVKHRHFMEQVYAWACAAGVTGSTRGRLRHRQCRWRGCGRLDAKVAAARMPKRKRSMRPAARRAMARPMSRWSHVRIQAKQPLRDVTVKAGEIRFLRFDPDPRWCGAEKLRQAGIKVHEGLMRDEACRVNAFLSRVSGGLPHVTLKLAVSKNGFMRTPMVSLVAALSRNIGHMLRATLMRLLLDAARSKPTTQALIVVYPDWWICPAGSDERSGYFPVACNSHSARQHTRCAGV